MYSAGAIKKNGDVVGKAFETKSEAEEYLLALAEKEEIKQGRIRNTATGETEIIEF